MKARYITLFLILFIISAGSLYSQPIPVELMVGNKFTSLDVTFTKPFKENSKLGFFI